MSNVFNLFGDIARSYVNTELTNVIGRAVSFAGEGIFGLVPGGLQNFARFNLANFGYLVDTVTGERLIFQYNVVPRESGGADYAEKIAIGRSVPHQHYRGGRARRIELPISFTMREFTRDDVRRNVRWLQSLCYPDYSSPDAIARAPHTLALVQGRLYSTELWVLKDYTVQWGDTVDPITQLPHEATVTLTLDEVAASGKSRADMVFV